MVPAILLAAGIILIVIACIRLNSPWVLYKLAHSEYDGLVIFLVILGVYIIILSILLSIDSIISCYP